MISSAELRSGKGARDENFPVASHLISQRHRPAILAFYEFVRIADDIADHARLSDSEKLARLDRLELSLLGQSDVEPAGNALRAILRERELSPVHAQDLLRAFRQDVTKRRYADWDDLVGYCRLSAMPVGRFVLDVHGESQETWLSSDALCTALQIINHVQDCAKDYRDLDRVYIPLDLLAENGTGVEAIAQSHASPNLRKCLRDIASRTLALLNDSHALSAKVKDLRLAMEIAAIQKLAERLVALLQYRDPLSEKVHLTKLQMLLTTGSGAIRCLVYRFIFRSAFSR